MVFVQGNMTAIAFIQDVHDKLDALANFETIHNEPAAAHWCIRKIDESLYIDFTSVQEAYDAGGNRCNANGIRVTFSSEWDAVNHLPSGSTNTMLILFGMDPYNSTNNNGYYDTLAKRLVYLNNPYTFTYWIDEYGLIGSFKNPYTEPLTSAASFFAIEFIPVAAREYDDGLNSIYANSIWSTSVNRDQLSNVNVGVRGLGTNSEQYNTFYTTRYAYKSTGNNKIYFDFMFYFNDFNTNAYNSPSARTKRWFYVEKVDAGLIAGDIVNYLDVEAAITRKFIVCEISAIDTALDRFIAIPYENAAAYT